MRRFRTSAALALGGPLLALAGCSNIFSPNPYGPPQAALMPAVPAYLLGDVIGGYPARLKKARAAGLKPVAVARRQGELFSGTSAFYQEIKRELGEILSLLKQSEA